MRKKEILFVTYQDRTFDEGLSYAIYLSGMMGVDLKVLLIGKKKLWETFEGLMSAVTFAEASEHDNASEKSGETPDPAHMVVKIQAMCDQANINTNIHTRLSSSTSVIKDFLAKPQIDMVLLSPSISKSSTLLKRLVNDSPRPVITINEWDGLAGI